MKSFFSQSGPWIIAGPCSAESEAQVMAAATAIKAGGVGVLRAGIWKPRTHPGCFEGVGEKGLVWLERVQRELGMRVCTEVALASHVEACLKHGVDMVWIGARTTSNPFLVQEIAESLRGTGLPVLVKNPVNPDLGLWLGAIERLQRQGIDRIGVVHRGFSTFDEIGYRNAPHWHVAIEMRSRYPDLPFFCDPSHMGGDRKYLHEISQRALDLGLDGLMIECHPDPSCALSDCRQQVTPEQLSELLAGLKVRTRENDDCTRDIESLRSRIDMIDGQIVRLLGERMEMSREIGRVKKAHNVSILQTVRWDEIMESVYRLADGCGLSRNYVDRIFNIIHNASAGEQNKILEEK